MTAWLTEPDPDRTDVAELFLGYLDWYRDVIVRKLDGLSDAELRASRLPSGWTPLELLKHLVFMERRWLRWGFEAEPVDDPWGDQGPDGRWRVAPEESLAGLVARLREGGDRTRAIVRSAALDRQARVGGRFGGGEPPRPLVWILFHVLQEYARHAGHLDIVRELIDGETGE